MTKPESKEEAQRDAEVVAACVSNPTKGNWAAFFERFSEFMRFWVFRKVRAAWFEDPEDTYQSLSVRLLEGEVLPAFDPKRARFRGFLFTVIKNHVAGRRRAALREGRLFCASLPDEISLSADEAFPRSREELIRDVEAYLAHRDIPEVKLAAFRAYLDLHEQPEVTEKLGISPATAYRYRQDVLAVARRILGLPPSD